MTIINKISVCMRQKDGTEREVASVLSTESARAVARLYGARQNLWYNTPDGEVFVLNWTETVMWE